MSYRANVLVVDDEQIVCNSCRKILARDGHNVQTTLSGRDALRKVEEDKYDVLIADWKMPELDGMEVIRIVKKNHPDIVLIMITGYPSVESAVQAMRLGVTNYVPKPINPAELSQTLRKALDERKSAKMDLLYYQKYIWAKVLEDGTVKIGVNSLFRESVGDILYVDLPCHRSRVEQGRMFIRILASDKQMHKLLVPIRGKVVQINHEINFNTDLINKDPFGKGWIAQVEPSNLGEDLKEWSGNVSIPPDRASHRLDSQNRIMATMETGRKSESHRTPSPAEERRAMRAPVARFLFSALAHRLFFLTLLPITVGAIIKGILYQVSPQGAN
jgi:CheY-like chemotaxis protein/glycine cleavage system H lipoate-binding protein